MKTFKQFINENVNNILKPKSKDDIEDIMKNQYMTAKDLFYAIRKYNVPKKYLPTDEEFYDIINKKQNLNALFSEILHHDMKYVKMFIDTYILPIDDKKRKQDYLNYSLEQAFKEVNPDAFKYLLELGANINTIKDTSTNVSGKSEDKQKLKKIYIEYKHKHNLDRGY